ncbi:DsbA family protein [Actinobaculum suis]|uniref:Thioredoxin domain-containing protein n=1 Tax=Actinobaculum suis TaxID=1657 RepID=A0AAW9HR66_9ACTO|nr:thioredoxin domain-containing protein [Actinobaculum suis]MDY5152674.1 thioredoxin domain-containing protein [Actinobaculum suis]
MDRGLSETQSGSEERYETVESTPKRNALGGKGYRILVIVLVIIALVVSALVLIFTSDPSRLPVNQASPSDRPTSVWTDPQTEWDADSSPSPDANASPTPNMEEVQAQNPIAARYTEIAEQKGLSAKNYEIVPTMYDSVRGQLMANPALPEGTPEALGPADAPVRVIVFSDYLCHYCQKLHEESWPVLEEKARRGEIRLEFYHYTIFSQLGSDKAAFAAHAAGLQGKFWEYSDLLFTEGATTPDAHGKARIAEDKLDALAQKLGLDMNKFHADMNSADTQNFVSGQTGYASSLGINATPAVIINGTYISGAYPSQLFENVIMVEKELLQDYPAAEQKAAAANNTAPAN